MPEIQALKIDCSSWKILIIDDKEAHRDHLKNLLSSTLKNLRSNQVYYAEDGARGYEYIEKYEPDLVFVDIEMPTMGGLEMMKYVKNLNLPHTHIIFVSQYFDQYLLQAIQFSSIAYLFKPVGPKELKEAVQKYIDSPIPSHTEKAIRDQAIENYYSGNLPRSITIWENGGNLLVKELVDIAYLEGNKNTTTFHFISGEQKMTRKNLGFYRDLTEDHFFLRASQYHYVNQLFVQELFAIGNSWILKLKSGVEIPVSRRNVKQVKQRLEEGYPPKS